MKLLAFADMHGSRKALAGIKSKAQKADLIVCCGDLTIFEQNLKGLLKELSRTKKPVLMIPGNHEMSAKLKKQCKAHDNLIYLDGGLFETETHIIMAAEGDGFALLDKKFEKVAKGFLRHIKHKRKTRILMTHAPPYGTKLDQLFDGHCGNKSVRDFILKARPKYAFSGHIHENNGKKDKLGSTILINPSPTGKIINV